MFDRSAGDSRLWSTSYTYFCIDVAHFFSVMRQNGVGFVDENCFEELLTVEISNDVWIGANVFMCGGVKFGDGAVVTNDVPP